MARKVARFLGRLAIGLIGVLVLAAATIYFLSERILRRTYDVPLTGFAAAADSASIVEGERLARVRGCSTCHGSDLRGQVFFEEPGVAVLWAPNLTQVAREYSDPELERVIRRGVKRDGRSVFAMPSDMFAGLADEDLSKIVAFIRSRPRIEGPRGEFKVGPLGRLGLVTRQFTPMAPDVVPRSVTRVPVESDTAWGHYLAQTVCTECHGMDLRGDPSGKPPNLRIAAGYTEADWFRLMRTGKGLGDRDLGLMSQVATRRLTRLTDAEIRALRTYLLTLTTTPP